MAPSTPSHKPRRRPNNGQYGVPHYASTSSQLAVLTKTGSAPFPLAHYFWETRAGRNQWILLPVILGLVFLYEWAVGLWGYSGFQSPPMHGDFEAQRHWMEITIHLPISQWYFHDLQWWGLDYPPLTAYHSWLLGKLGSMIEPGWFALRKSRGLDDPGLKTFMRATVIASEYLIYVPACLMLVSAFTKAQHLTRWESRLALAAILLQPGTILVDNAHFQYNTVMLGFVIAFIVAASSRSYGLSCLFFVAALGFKQMALYYAPVVFAFLLGSCIVPRINIFRLFIIASITALSFALLFAPLLIGSFYETLQGHNMGKLPEPPLLSSLKLDKRSLFYTLVLQLGQAVHRIFPFARGLFEDKVANVWCALHTFHKLHRYPQELLQRVSLGATLLSIVPSSVAIGIYPRVAHLPWALASCAWGFFLCSFQVHEKSVLLPLLPMTLLLSCQDGLLPATRSWITFANILGCWTMFPLLKRDELRVPYFVLTLFWAYIMGAHTMLMPAKTDKSAASIWVRLIHGSFYTAMTTWHFAEAFAPPIEGKPDIWVVANVLIGVTGFGLCYLWCTWRLLRSISTPNQGRIATTSASMEKKTT